jgi:hypothetical protein
MLRKREQVLPKINNVWIKTHNSMLISFSCILCKMSKLITAIKSNPNKGDTSLFVRVSTAMKITQLACITYGKSINCLVIYCYISPIQTKGRHHYSLTQSVCTTYGKSINWLCYQSIYVHKSSRSNKTKMESKYDCVS